MTSLCLRYYGGVTVASQARHRHLQSRSVEQAVSACRARHGRDPTDEGVRGLVVRSRSPKTAVSEDAFQAWRERAKNAGADPRSWDPQPSPLPQTHGRRP